LKPLYLSEFFRSPVRDYPRETRARIGRTLGQLELDFGHPHRHRGLGIPKLTGNYFEVRVGLEIRLIFQNRNDCLLFIMAGNHDEVQRFIRGR
jgi:hypothetical protein